MRGLGVGDEVWGAIYPSADGSHQDYCLANQNCIFLKPDNLSHVETASIPYTALTAWAAISGLGLRPGSRVLVVGGAGGVGRLASQLLEKYHGCHVTVAASEEYHDTLADYGDFQLVDNRKNPEALQRIGKVDLVLDCAGLGLETARLSMGTILAAGGSCVSLSSPLLSNTDRLGVLPGLATSLASFLELNTNKSSKQRYKWAFYQPDSRALEIFRKLLDNKTVRPCVTEVYSFDNLIDAYHQVEAGHLKGKIVIDMEKL